MYEIIFLLILSFCYLIFAVIQDFKSREIADWLNYSLIIFALGFRFFYSLFNENNFNFFIQGFIGFLIFLGLANLFYYSRLFAGGDAKLMMALGAILPLDYSFSSNLLLFLNFLFYFFIASLIYVLISSVFLTLKNFKSFKIKFIKEVKFQKRLIILSWLFFFLSTILNFVFLSKFNFVFLGFFILVLTYSYIYSKSLDECCMIKEVLTKNLTEGDWLYKDVRLKKETIKSKWEGLTKEEIRKIRLELKKVKIRQGIPFSPTFLLGFLLFVISYFFKINLWNPLW
jgi:Flp pilus assembly protein protease CpaA